MVIYTSKIIILHNNREKFTYFRFSYRFEIFYISLDDLRTPAESESPYRWTGTKNYLTSDSVGTIVYYIVFPTIHTSFRTVQ